MIDLAECSWPVGRAPEAMKALAKRAGIRTEGKTFAEFPAFRLATDRNAVRTWVHSVAASLGLGIESVPATYAGFDCLADSGPVVIEIVAGDELRLLAVSGLSRGRIELVTTRLTTVRVDATELRSALASKLENELQAPLGKVLQEAGVARASGAKVLRAMFEERLGKITIAEAWRLSAPISAGMGLQFRRAGVLKQLGLFVAAYGAEYVLWIGAWILAGQWALAGRFDKGWLLAWGLVLLTIAPIRALGLWNQSKLVTSSGWVMMRLLLEGSFRLDPEEVRYQGAGQLLSRVLDTEALHSLALTGGLMGLIAILQLMAVAALFAFAADGLWLAALLAAWIGLTLGTGWVYYRRRREWTVARLAVTAETTERMIGHRTRMVQQPRESWHKGEDEALTDYVDRSRRIDLLGVVFSTLLPRGWLIVGIAAMAPGIVDGSETAPLLAAQLGTVLLAYNSLRGLGSALASLSGAAIALERARDLLMASKRTEPAGDPAIAVTIANPSTRPLLEMREVTYRYPRRGVDVVQRSSVQIADGDYVLLAGSSGSGKSTWCGLASGIRVPDSGLLFLKGIDRKTLGAREWRRRIVSSPQFHENYILAGSLAFNLLLARGWPPEPNDLWEAEQVCRDLGLGPLIDAMPSGLMQTVGETGWQLSNGEKSRVFLARALLQRADLMILDETFAALDPETAQLAMDCVRKRARSLVCIAHV